jgi:hypothetical protein
MDKEYPEEIVIHLCNSGIVHLPGRRFPAVAVQGDSLSVMLSSVLSFIDKAKEHKDEDMFYEAQDLAEKLRDHLKQYEAVLQAEGFEKPYILNIDELNIDGDY